MRTVSDLRAYFVTDADLCESVGRTVRKTVIAAVESGTTCVQLRAKGSDGRPFLEEVLEVTKAVGEKVPVIVNSRVDAFLVARVLGAQVASVRAGQSDLPAPLAHTLVGEDAHLGLSIDIQEGAQAAREKGAADHVSLPVLRTVATKTDTPDILGFEGCEYLKRIIGIPAVAINGIGVDNMVRLAQVGIGGGATVSTICCVPGLVAIAVQLLAQ